MVLTLSQDWTNISLERPRVLKKCTKNVGSVGYLPLESNISNWSNTAYLKSQVDMLSFTIKHCQFFTLLKGNGAGVTVGKCIFFFFFFFAFRSRIFTSFLSLLPSLFFCLFLRFLVCRSLSCAWLLLTGLHYKSTTVNRTFLVRKFDHFFLTSEAFHAPVLHARELVCILLFLRILPY